MLFHTSLRGSLGCIGVFLLTLLPARSEMLHLVVEADLVLLSQVLKLPLFFAGDGLGRAERSDHHTEHSLTVVPPMTQEHQTSDRF